MIYKCKYHKTKCFIFDLQFIIVNINFLFQENKWIIMQCIFLACNY